MASMRAGGLAGVANALAGFGHWGIELSVTLRSTPSNLLAFDANDASNLEVRLLIPKTGFFLTNRRVEIRVVVDFP